MKKNRYFFGSLTRISDLETKPFEVCSLGRNKWETGDYVVGKFISLVGACSNEYVELATGRRASIQRDDLVVGALGVRQATLESVGDWKSIGADLRMQDLTHAGLFGRETSHSILIPPHPSFIYQGHVVRDGKKVRMRDFVKCLSNEVEPFQVPTISIVGTSMSSGKTTAARTIIHVLKDMGLCVVGAKLTGAGHYSDILSMFDAGADDVVDFVDAGIPSSVMPPEEYKNALQWLLSNIASLHPDVVVAEVGASPFEQYNGFVALNELVNHNHFTVLCASDPYAAIGLAQSLGVKPDVISGITTTTSAGVELVERATGVPALSLNSDGSINALRHLLGEALGVT